VLVFLFKKNQVVYLENTTPLGIYYVKSGRVKMYKQGSDGKEKIIRIGFKGEMLSYASLISDNRYKTSAIALEDTSLIFISKQDFWSQLKYNEGFLTRFLKVLSNDMISVQVEMTDLDSLLSLMEKFTKVDDKASISMSRKDLACYVGTAKETINRLLSEFRQEKLITTNATNINIIDPTGLQRISNLYN